MKEEKWWIKKSKTDIAQSIISRRADSIRRMNKWMSEELAHCFAIEQYITVKESLTKD